jgi:hypothetical protein
LGQPYGYRQKICAASLLPFSVGPEQAANPAVKASAAKADRIIAFVFMVKPPDNSPQYLAETLRRWTSA